MLSLSLEEIGPDAESGSEEKDQDERKYCNAAKYTNCSGPFHELLRSHNYFLFALEIIMATRGEDEGSFDAA